VLQLSGTEACPSTGAPAKPLSPFGAAALGGGGFGAAGGASAKAPGGPANPFSGAGGAKLFTENPARLSPTMEPDSFTERPWWQTITFGQIVRAPGPHDASVPLVQAQPCHIAPQVGAHDGGVRCVQVIVLSFTTIIALMIGTFFVVLKAGGVHFNE